MADDLKIRVQVESKAAEAALERTAAKVANVKTSASTGSGAWAAYTGAMRAATGAVRGFFSALGIVGAVMGGINMVISMWKTLSETIRGPAVRAAEEAKKAAEDLKKAQEEAARAAQERFESATNAAREYIQTLKEAAALEQAKLSDRSRIRSANTTEANANIDRQIATGETSKTSGDAQKRMNSLLARQAELEDARRTAKQALGDARAARDAKARDLQEAVAEEQRTGIASREADAANAAFAKNHAAGRAGVGLIAAAQEERTRRELGTKAAEAAARHDAASATVDTRQAFLDAAEDHLAEVVSQTARNLEIYDAELAANAAEMAAAEAEFEARATKERASTLDALGKEAAAEANKELDRQAAAGEISSQQAAAQQVVNSLQAQLDALVKARDEGGEIAGVQWDSAWIEKALAEVQGRLADAVAKATALAGSGHDAPKVSSSMVSAGSDPWQRIGAFAGGWGAGGSPEHPAQQLDRAEGSPVLHLENRRPHEPRRRRNHAMSTLIKKGNLAARLSMEESGVKLADASATATLVYRGDLAELKTKAGGFTVGQTSSAVPANLNISGDTFKVTGVEITGGPGGTGRLTVGLSAVSNSSVTVLPTEKGVDWQLDWTLVEKPLEQHPGFAALFTDSSTFAKIETWKKLSDYGYISEKAQFTVPNDLDNPTIWVPLTGDALKFCQKLAKGIAAYQVQVPVVRKTETTVSGPGLNASSRCGMRQAPPKFADLANAWLKTADSWSKNGQSKWEHVQAWSGFDSLDEDLYPSS